MRRYTYCFSMITIPFVNKERFTGSRDCLICLGWDVVSKLLELLTINLWNGCGLTRWIIYEEAQIPPTQKQAKCDDFEAGT